MYHFNQPIQNTRGDALVGYFLKAVSTTDGTTASIYADESSTPIVTVSGVADMVKVNSDGMADFWIEGGEYHLDIYATDASTFIKRNRNVPMVDVVGVASDASSAASSAAASAAVVAGLSAATGASLVGFAADATGAVTRTVQDKLRDVISVKDLGVIGNGVADDTAALNAIGASGLARVVFPAGCTPLITDTVSFGSGLAFEFVGDARLIYAGTRDRPAFISGISGTNQERMRCSIAIEAQTRDWTSTGFIGAIFKNCEYAEITVTLAKGFRTGIKLMGEGVGCTYNKMFLGKLISNQVHLMLSNSGGGYVNENMFFGGAFRNISNEDVGLSRWGVVITSDDGAYVNNNRNVFYKPSFELMGMYCTGSADGTPAEVEYGAKNEFHDCRTEGASKNNVAMRVRNSSADNRFEDGYSLIAVLDNQSNRGLNIVTRPRSRGAIHTRRSVPDVPSLFFYDGSDGGVQGMGILGSGSGTPVRTTSNVTQGTDYVEIGSTRAVMEYWELNGCNLVKIKRKTKAGFPGRVVVKIYDAAGALISGTGTLLGAGSSDSLTWGTTWGGAWVTSSDDASDLYVALPLTAVYVGVAFAGGSATQRLQAYELEFSSFDHPSDAVAARKVPQFKVQHERARCIDNLPTVGTHVQGETRQRYTTTAGGPLVYVCTAAGTPGTWTTVAGVVKQTGITAATGTALTGAFASYAGATMSAAYTQTEAQATNDAVKNASQRIKALEDALRSAGVIG